MTASSTESSTPLPQRRFSRRRALKIGLSAGAVAAAGGSAALELISHGVLPGRVLLDKLEGACSVAPPPLHFAPVGPERSGSFVSSARGGRTVGYTIAWPPAHAPGDALPLVVMLHGFGANHATAMTGMSPAQAVALRVGGAPLPAMAIVTVDGGNDYWNPHPGDDPMAMVFQELVPMCQGLALGRPPQPIGLMGISMGGFGALFFAERAPRMFGAVAAISPAVWTSYDQAHRANAGAYASVADFDADDVVTHAAALTGVPVRIASGVDDPFYPGVQALARALPAGAEVHFPSGCHTSPFFIAQEPPSLQFLGKHLTAPT